MNSLLVYYNYVLFVLIFTLFIDDVIMRKKKFLLKLKSFFISFITIINHREEEKDKNTYTVQTRGNPYCTDHFINNKYKILLIEK